MASLYDFLAQGTPSEAETYGLDPFWNAAKSVSSWKLQPQTSSEAIYMPAIQGLLQGFLAGVGKNNVTEDLFDEYKKLPGMQSVLMGRPDDAAFGPLTSADAAIADTPMYLSEDAPAGWKPTRGKADYIQTLLAQEVKQEEASKKQAFQDEVEAKIQAAIDPRVIDAERKKKELDEPDWFEKAPSAVQTQILGAKSTTDELYKLGQDLEKLNLPKGVFSVARKIGGLDANLAQGKLNSMLGNLVRLSGDVGNATEQEQARQLQATLGNWTASSADAAKLTFQAANLHRSLTERKTQAAKVAYGGGGDSLLRELSKPLGAEGSSAEEKTVGGRTYVKVPGGWRAK